jgi:O-antigen/teichoic acid export membrane protein
MNQIKIGTVLTYLIQFLQILIAILYTPVMLRILGKSEFGLYSLVLSITGVLSILDLGFGNTIVRYTTKYKALKDKDTEYNLNGMFLVLYSFIGLITAIVGILIVLNMELWFTSSLKNEEIERLRILLIISSINLSLSFPLSVFGSILMAYERFIFIKLISLVRILLNPIIMLPFLLNGFGSITMISTLAVLNICGLLINTWYCLKFLKVRFYFNNWQTSLLKDISNFAFYIFLIQIVDKIYWSTDQIILGITKGTSEVSIYSIGATFTSFFITFTSVISSLQLPYFTKLVSFGVSDKTISERFIKLSRIQFIFASYIYGGFLFIGKDFITLWAGEEFESSFYIALIIITGLIFAVVQNSAIAVVQAKNLNRFRAIAQVVIALINVALTIPLASKYGALGAAIATGFTYFFINNIVMSIYYYKKVKLDIFELWKQLSKFIPSFILIFVLLFFMNYVELKNIYIELILKGLSYTTLYVGVTYFFNINTYEKNLFNSFIVKIKGRLA